MNDKTHPMSDDYDWSEPKTSHVPPLPPPPPPPPPIGTTDAGKGGKFTQCRDATNIIGLPFDTNKDNSSLFSKVTFNYSGFEKAFPATVFTINSAQLEILITDPEQWEEHGFDLDLLDNSCFHVVLTNNHQFHGSFDHNSNLRY